MATPVWTDVVDKFRGKKSLDRVAMEDLERERIALDLQERKQIQQSQDLERQKEKHFAQGLRETSDRMKLYYARKVKEIDADVRLNDDVLRALSHKIRIYNGIIAVKKRIRVLVGDKKGLENRVSLPELTQYMEKNTVDGELKDQQLEKLMKAVEGGASVTEDVGATEEQDVQQILTLMRNAPVNAKSPEDIAKESMAQVNKVLREKP